MSSKNSQSAVTKFSIWGVVLVAASLGFTLLAVFLSDISTFTLIALPIGLLGASMFYRHRLDLRSKA